MPVSLAGEGKALWKSAFTGRTKISSIYFFFFLRVAWLVGFVSLRIWLCISHGNPHLGKNCSCRKECGTWMVRRWILDLPFLTVNSWTSHIFFESQYPLLFRNCLDPKLKFNSAWAKPIINSCLNLNIYLSVTLVLLDKWVPPAFTVFYYSI